MKKILLSGLISISLISPAFVYAVNDQSSVDTSSSATRLENPLGGSVNNISDLVFKVVNFLASFLLAIAAFFIIYSGFKFVSASGNPEKLKEAKDSLKNALIGTALILVASTVGVVVENLIKSLQN